MKGHVPTPSAIVDRMVAKLFRDRNPRASDLVIDPGCGDGPFIEGILRHCKARGCDVPWILGVELDPWHLARARAKFQGADKVRLVLGDYLAEDFGPAEFIVGNPPYVPITQLSVEEKQRYRSRFETARGRFDLYLLFMEQSLRNLWPGGRLCFITPEKFEYVATAAPLRRLLVAWTLTELHHLGEETFPGLVTYPTITTVVKEPPLEEAVTRVIPREGRERQVVLPTTGESWSGPIHGSRASPGVTALADVALRVSCGVATGADRIFVMAERDVPQGLRRFARPTVSGRQLALAGDRIETRDVMLLPYDAQGALLPEERLGDLRIHLGRADHQRALKNRTCFITGRKQWYAFHDSAPLPEILRPKILCKDVASRPRFWSDPEGRLVPRHSTYYVVPHPETDFDALVAYLNGPVAAEWLREHCQRAANGYLRLQSSILKRLPVPDRLRPGRSGGLSSPELAPSRASGAAPQAS